MDRLALDGVYGPSIEVDICFACGFNSPSTFYQAFKKFSGNTTPRQFRRQRIA